MYSGQFLEMYSHYVHAQNLADSEQKRVTNEPIDAPASERTSLTDTLRRIVDPLRVRLGRGYLQCARRATVRRA